MTCRDVMTSNPVCCVPSDTAARAAQLMKTENVGSLPVVHDQQTRKLAGIITDRDLAMSVLAERRDSGTRVEELMTRSVATCHPDDDYHDVLDRMERSQVRRVPVVDDQGCVCGIVAQADIATRVSQPDEVAEVVGEISQPSGSDWLHPSRWSRANRSGAGDAIKQCMIVTAGVGAGVALMYFLDPGRGGHRRAIVRDKAMRYTRKGGEFLGKGQRDLSNRATGLLAEARSAFSREPVADEKLCERVRSKIGRAVSHPHAIQVRALNGDVELSGPVLAKEAAGLISCVRKVPGVHSVQDRLDIHEQAGSIPDLQGGSARGGHRREIMQENWSPAFRLLAGALGGGLALYGLRGGMMRKTVASVGAGLMARGFSNRSFSGIMQRGSQSESLVNTP